MAEDQQRTRRTVADEVVGEIEAEPTREHADDSASRHRVGERLGPYSLRRVIGRGAMATVFEAEHTLIGRNVAIKVLHEEAAENATAVARFFQEAQAMNRLRHPFIIEITDVAEGCEEHAPFMVMELLQGETLDQLITTRGPLAPARVADIGRQICDAMEAVHQANIVHRDLKPENILVLDGGTRHPKVKLLDFGVAKFLGTEENALRTRTGAIVGTPEYMAPEQVRGQAVDARADIYSLGCILYEMLCGLRPFQSTQLGELLRLQLQHTPLPPSAAAGELADGTISKHFDGLVAACMQKDPAKRPRSMADVADQLFAALDVKDTAVIRVPKSLSDEYVKLTAPKREAPPPPRRRIWLALAAGVLLLVGALALWFVLRPSRAKAPTSDAQYSTAPSDASVPRDAVAHAGPVRPARATLRLRSRPAGAAVYDGRDGRFLGRTPLPLPRPPADRLLVLRAAGYQEQRFTLTPGSGELVTVELAPLEPGRRPPMANGQMRPPPMPPEPRPPVRRVGEWGTVDPFGPMSRK